MAKDKIMFVMDADHGTQYHRMMIPSVSMKQAGVNVGGVKSVLDLFTREDLREIKAVVFSRFAIVTNHKNLRKWCDQYGIKIIVDIDDRWYLDGDKSHAKWYNEHSKPYIEKTIKIADIVWAASKYLAKRVEKAFNVPRHRVFYVPNGINPDINGWDYSEQPQGDEPIFGYVAAMGHDKDIISLRGLFDGKKIAVVDYPDAPKAGYTTYSEFFGGNSIIHKPYDLHNYSEMYDSINVSIAPLAKTDFNLCKSSLKIQEAGFKKRAIIASNIALYNDIIEHNKTGILCSNRAEWEHAINTMTVQKSIDLGNALYERVKDEFNIHSLNKIRYGSIFSTPAME